jgi:hypothetical protein
MSTRPAVSGSPTWDTTRPAPGPPSAARYEGLMRLSGSSGSAVQGLVLLATRKGGGAWGV